MIFGVWRFVWILGGSTRCTPIKHEMFIYLCILDHLLLHFYLGISSLYNWTNHSIFGKILAFLLISGAGVLQALDIKIVTKYFPNTTNQFAISLNLQNLSETSFWFDLLLFFQMWINWLANGTNKQTSFLKCPWDHFYWKHFEICMHQYKENPSPRSEENRIKENFNIFCYVSLNVHTRQ